MAKKSISNDSLGNRIKERRVILGLTIEEAAKRAGVGTKTWSRYEAGEPIREDKYRGVCIALKWSELPMEDNSLDIFSDLEKYKSHRFWSKYIEERFGEFAAAMLALGSDSLLEDIDGALDELALMPAGTHVGQINMSMLPYVLPKQFLMRYDYNFVFALKIAVLDLQRAAEADRPIIAHRVIDELVIYLCVEEARFLSDKAELDDGQMGDWIFELFDDMDIITMLYSDLFVLDEGNIYHYEHWFEKQFYI